MNKYETCQKDINKYEFHIPKNKQLIDYSNIGRLYVFTQNQHNRLILESYKNADIQKLPKNE